MQVLTITDYKTSALPTELSRSKEGEGGQTLLIII